VSAQEIDLSPLADRDPLTLKEAAYCWAGLLPTMNVKALREKYPEKLALADAWLQKLQNAAKAGKLDHDRPDVVCDTWELSPIPLVSSGGWGDFEHPSRQRVKTQRKAPVPWPEVLVFRAALRVYADSIGQRPAFLFDPELPDNGESSSLPKGNPKDWRIDLIRLVIASKEWPPLSIPTTGKATIRRVCIDTLPAYFTASTFEAAWKKAVASGIVRTENHETYARRD